MTPSSNSFIWLWLTRVAVCCFICLKAEAKLAEPGWHSGRFFHDNSLRQYRYYVPALQGDEQAAVVLFHQGGQSMDDVFGEDDTGFNRWMDLAESEGIVLFVPNGSDLRTGKGKGRRQYWNDCRPSTKRKNRRVESDEVGFIRKLIGKVSEEVSFDPTRIYATGVGEGGMMALRMAFEAPDLIAAVAVVNCSAPLNPECSPRRIPVPIFAMNGTKDEIFPWIGGQIRGRDGYIVSVPKMRTDLAGYNRVDRTEQELRQIGNKEKEDGCTVKRQFFKGRETGADLCFYTIQGGGFTIPSLKYPQSRKMTKRFGDQCHDVEMAVEAWHFLKAYSLEQRLRLNPL